MKPNEWLWTTQHELAFLANLGRHRDPAKRERKEADLGERRRLLLSYLDHAWLRRDWAEAGIDREAVEAFVRFELEDLASRQSPYAADFGMLESRYL